MSRLLRLIHLLPLAIALAATPACQTAESKAAHAAVERGALLLDVRTAQEYASGHLDGAVNIPIDQLERRLDEVGPTDREVVVYCEVGARSAYAATVLERAGYGKVVDLGPMGAW